MWQCGVNLFFFGFVRFVALFIFTTATVPKYAWGAGFYFWMETTKAVSAMGGTTLTCHQASLVGSGSGGDFGGGLDVINGGLGTCCGIGA